MIGGSHSPTPVKSSMGESQGIAVLAESTVAARGRGVTPDMRTGVIETERERLAGGTETRGRGGSVEGRVVDGVLSFASDVSGSDLQEGLERSPEHATMDFLTRASSDASSGTEIDILSSSVSASTALPRAGSSVKVAAEARRGEDGGLD